MDCINIKPCNQVVYSLVNPFFYRDPHKTPPRNDNHTATGPKKEAKIRIQFENTNVSMNIQFCLANWMDLFDHFKMVVSYMGPIVYFIEGR